MDEVKKEATDQEPAAKTFRSFLESTPPYTMEVVSDALSNAVPTPSGNRYEVEVPDIQLPCESEHCGGGIRFFAATSSGDIFDSYLDDRVGKNIYLEYVCRNCEESSKIYSLYIRRNESGNMEAMKYGEWPQFGPKTPARVITLIGPDRDMFLSGRRAENLGMGIGAFAYYRRVVENQKGRIIEEIAKASAKLGASPELLSELNRAAKETQFSKAIDQIKAGIPSALLIDGHNPLTLLHTALSDGLHDRSDKECLEIAQEIRLVLTELAERISEALREEAELSKAVKRLMNRK